MSNPFVQRVANWLAQEVVVKGLAENKAFQRFGLKDAEIREFFESHPIPQGQLTLDQHLEKLSVNVALREREGTRIGR